MATTGPERAPPPSMPVVLTVSPEDFSSGMPTFFPWWEDPSFKWISKKGG